MLSNEDPNVQMITGNVKNYSPLAALNETCDLLEDDTYFTVKVVGLLTREGHLTMHILV